MRRQRHRHHNDDEPPTRPTERHRDYIFMVIQSVVGGMVLCIGQFVELCQAARVELERDQGH